MVPRTRNDRLEKQIAMPDKHASRYSKQLRAIACVGLVAALAAASVGSAASKSSETPPAKTQPLPADAFPETLARMPRAHAEDFTSEADRAAWKELLQAAPAVADTSGSL